MFVLTFLGTAASVPSPARGLSSLLVEHGPRRFLVDCGEGTQRQIIRAGIGLRRLDRVLLTHGHLDHLLGLGGLAGTLNLWGAVERLTVHGGAATLELARKLLLEVVWPGGSPIPVAFAEVRPGVPVADDGVTVSAFPVRHRAPDCFGYRFEEPPHRPMHADRLAALGVPAGPERGRLAAGESVVLADGRRIDPDDVLGPARPGARVAVVGDAESTEDLIPHVAGVDLLVIEATFLERDRDKARARSHLTAAEAGELAARAGVGRLCLTHLSERYAPEEVEAEARARFPHVRVAADFDRVTVAAGGEGAVANAAPEPIC